MSLMELNNYIEISEMSSDEITGRRKIKKVIHEIYDSTDKYNLNGISWNEKYTEQNIETVQSMPIIVSFLDENQEIPVGHGELEISADGDVTFKDSVVVGVYEKGYIGSIEINKEKKKVLIGEGYLYNQRYPKFIKWLEDKVKKETIKGSVEVGAKSPNKTIIYDGGYKKIGRVPMEYTYTGDAILYLETEADSSAVLIELNNYKKEAKTTLKDVAKGKTIELSELNYDDISAIIIRAFNRLMKSNSDDYYYDGYFIHRLFPVSSRAIMKKYSEPGKYYMVPYTIKNTEVILGDVVEAEEDWKPVDENPVEINMSILKDMFTNKEGGKKMEGIIKEKDSKIEVLTNQINELNSKNKELDDKVNELNSTLVEVNKLLEAEKQAKEELNIEVNSLRKFKQQEDEKAKKAEINSYFENEVKKNGFTEAELNSLKTEYVDKMDLEGLKSKETELCVKKIKEINSVQKSTETNSVDKDLFMSIHNTEKSEEDVSDLF